jgi:PST family polysaccharide transporter
MSDRRATPPAVGAEVPARTRESNSYGQILRSSALVGGASAVTLLAGILRGKAVAVLLGPAGVGLIGIYSAIAMTASTVAGLGLANSAVRAIAAAQEADVTLAVRKAKALRRGSWWLGWLGAALCVLLATPLSRWSFGDEVHVTPLILLAPAVLFGVVGAAQTAVLQSTRRVRSLAEATVLGAVAGLVVAVPLYWGLGVEGIVPSIVLGALVNLVVAGAYARRELAGSGTPAERPVSADYAQLLRLGVFLMASGLSTVLGGYVVRALVVRSLGIEAAGLYQAAFGLGGSLIGFVLSAMGTDFYPRLAAAAADKAQVTRLVNEQGCVSLLLALPGLATLIAAAPVLLRLLYAPGFEAAVPLLRLMTLGFLGRVVSWPLGYILLARGNGAVFLALEAATVAVQVTGAAWGLRGLGLEATGLAFVASYCVYTALVLGVARRLVGFRWTPANLRLGLAVGAGCGLVWLAACPLGQGGSALLAVAVGAGATAYTLRELRRRTGVDLVRQLTGRFAAAPAGGGRTAGGCRGGGGSGIDRTDER